MLLKNIAIIIKHANLSCRKHTDNIVSEKLILKNKVIREKLKCANCVAEKSRSFKTKV